MTALGRHHRLLFAMGWLVSACSNPGWDSERYRVTGILGGQSCTLQYNGLPGLPVEGGGRLYVRGNLGLVNGQDSKLIQCAGLLVLLLGPRGPLLAVGTYSVNDQRSSDPPPGTLHMTLEDRRISGGRWPFVSDGMVNFIGLSGTMWIDSVAPNTVYGRFDIVGRRQARGP
jgi:hypothetical protein